VKLASPSIRIVGQALRLPSFPQDVVESFAITGLPKAKRRYAWSFLEGSEPRYVTALGIPPVDSPQTAVRAAIASKVQK